MKTKISKIFNVISYVFTAVIVVVAAFTAYDCYIFKDDAMFWYVAHENAKYILTVALIGLVFPLVMYISNFRDQENAKYKNRAEIFMSIFIVGLISAIILLVSPIEINLF